MKHYHLAIVIVGIGTLLVLHVLHGVLLLTPSGVRISNPYEGATVPRTVIVAGDAWMRDGIEGITVTATPLNGDSPIVVDAERAFIKHKNVPIRPLAAYRAELKLPDDGDYSLRVEARGGVTIVHTESRVITASGPGVSKELGFFSVAHIIPLVIVTLTAIFMPLLIRRRGGRRAREIGALAIVAVLYVNEIVYQIFWFHVGGWTIGDALPLHMCSIAIFLIPVMYFTENSRLRQWLFDILYFWGLGGAVQALLTPYVGFHVWPSMKYVGYFVSHGTIVIGVVYMAVVYRMDLNVRSLLRAIIVTALATAAAYGINMAMQFIPPYEPGNYFVMGYPPPTGSVVDIFESIFGPTPRYVVGLAAMTVVVFTLLWLPFPIRRARHRNSRQI